MTLVKIESTNKIEELEIIDVKTGTRWTEDFIGNAIIPGCGVKHAYDEDFDFIMEDEETFDWWLDACSRNQAQDEKQQELLNDYDCDIVYRVFEEMHEELNGEYGDTIDLEEFEQRVKDNN